MQSTPPGAGIPVTSGRREPFCHGINAEANLRSSVPLDRSLCDGAAIVSPSVISFYSHLKWLNGLIVSGDTLVSPPVILGRGSDNASASWPNRFDAVRV